MKEIQNRRTIRQYSTQPVSDELLHQLLETAERTPTMGNLPIIVVQRAGPNSVKPHRAMTISFRSSMEQQMLCSTLKPFATSPKQQDLARASLEQRSIRLKPSSTHCNFLH